jgi:hypothetical protein
MIKYKYSFYWDIVWYLRNKKNAGFLHDKNIKYISFTFEQLLKNIFKPEKPKIDLKDKNLDITCYFISSGTWGAYTPPNKIFICPKNIEKAGGLERVIKHEITHILNAKNTESFSHEDKEEFIKEREKNL